MKTRDVPQDDAAMLGGHKRAMYAVDDKGDYVMVSSKGWEVEVAVNSQAVDEIRQQLEAVQKKVLAGELSPLAYHMQRCMMSPGLLSANSGIWRWRVKRHLKPAVFAKLDDKVLQRYADALGITVAQLKTVSPDSETND